MLFLRHASNAARKMAIPSAEFIVAVASGKGGVGKSTIAVNLAVALAHRLGPVVGLMDADVFGPSVHHMMNLHQRPTMTEHDAAVWRGPMVMSAIGTFCNRVDWSARVLVIDMPPGTGDAQLSITQQLPLSGAVIVSTPQDIALIDAHRGIEMFRKVNVPILGVVENQSYYVCPSCGDHAHVFGHGGAAKVAEELGVTFLGEVPLDIAIRMQGDAGVPIVEAAPESPQALALSGVADRVWSVLKEGPAVG